MDVLGILILILFAGYQGAWVLRIINEDFFWFLDELNKMFVDFSCINGFQQIWIKCLIRSRLKEYKCARVNNVLSPYQWKKIQQSMWKNLSLINGSFRRWVWVVGNCFQIYFRTNILNWYLWIFCGIKILKLMNMRRIFTNIPKPSPTPIKTMGLFSNCSYPSGEASEERHCWSAMYLSWSW
jgi:hypothetical protein